VPCAIIRFVVSHSNSSFSMLVYFASAANTHNARSHVPGHSNIIGGIHAPCQIHLLDWLRAEQRSEALASPFAHMPYMFSANFSSRCLQTLGQLVNLLHQCMFVHLCKLKCVHIVVRHSCTIRRSLRRSLRRPDNFITPFTTSVPTFVLASSTVRPHRRPALVHDSSAPNRCDAPQPK